MPKTDAGDENRKAGMAYAAVTSLVVSVVVLMGIGWLLDRWLQTSPWLLVAGVVVGSFVGLFELVRISSKIS